ncbi:MAG: nicotinamide mononucleotide transporter [Verrucomicrobiota bacterium]|jgi:nicotinamide mononucleotide transporter
MEVQGFFAGQGPEYIGTVLAVVSVILIARQHILGWPVGILWAMISAWLAFTRWHLVSDGILYVSYVPLQIYCWISWQTRGSKREDFRPTWLTRRWQVILFLGAILAVVIWGNGVKFFSQQFSWTTPPALLWRDATTTVLSYFAQFLQARKRMENWFGWAVVNVLGIHIYLLQGSVIYAAQYGFFLILGLYGWWSWYRTSKEDR